MDDTKISEVETKETMHKISPEENSTQENKEFDKFDNPECSVGYFRNETDHSLLSVQLQKVYRIIKLLKI